MIGSIMYAYFHGCDPLLTGKIGAPDQVIYFEDTPYSEATLFLKAL